MTAVLNTNQASLYASKNLQSAQSRMADSVERLSSGLRINRAKDDAAGLGIANSLTSQINSANQGIRNLNDGISLVQTAEGAIGAAQEMAQRILTLAVQGSNGTLGLTERTAIQSEMNTLLTAMDLISTRTTFSGNTLLNTTVGVSSGTKFTLQAGKESTDKIELAETAFKMVGKTTGQATAVSDLIVHADITSTVAATAQTKFRAVATSAATLVENLSTQRSLLGAYQNQIEYTVSNVTELSANLSAARSNVQDTDYASETASLTKGQILQQAATAMLAQANQMPNVILSLLK
jgi:flagellin